MNHSAFLNRSKTAICFTALLLAVSVPAMDLAWTQPNAQWPVETAPLVVDLNHDAQPEILILNRGGQLLHWSGDGQPLGEGQGGAVCTLPKDDWPTTPTLARTRNGMRILVCSVKGLVVCLDSSFTQLWEYKLPGETTWGRATPAILETGDGIRAVYGDHSGALICLGMDGSKVWTKQISEESCNAPLRVLDQKEVLVSFGNTLYRIDTKGDVIWQRDLGGKIFTRAELLGADAERMILCGAGEGSLYALSMDGEILWQAPIGDEIDTSIAFLPQPNGDPLILCTGLWGNLHAIDLKGRHVWTHLYRAKGRGVPTVLKAENGETRILVSTYDQHVYAFDANGCLVDKIRLSGAVNTSPTIIYDPLAGRTDALVSTVALLTHRIRTTSPKATYGEAGQPENISVELLPPDNPGGAYAALLKNPQGALVSINAVLVCKDKSSEMGRMVIGRITQRSLLEIPLPASLPDGNWVFELIANDTQNIAVAAQRYEIAIPARKSEDAASNASVQGLRVWPAYPYTAFDENQLEPSRRETPLVEYGKVAASGLYRNQTGQAAFIAASTLENPTRFIVALKKTPVTKNNETFAGEIDFHEAVTVGTVNGERIADALPVLGSFGLVTLPARHAAKIWISISTGQTPPGLYQGEIEISTLYKESEPITVPFEIEVLPLQLPEEFPLTFCTWDYVPNGWFPKNTSEVLDDMKRHGVNVFPRSIAPQGNVDAAGKLTMDWTRLDTELERLRGRGIILFHISTPTIKFETEPDNAAKHQHEIAYLRQFRDYLKKQGMDYKDYAFYPMDEPGLEYGRRVPGFIESAKRFREADPKFLIYTDPVPGLSYEDFKAIEPLVDVWCPNMHLVSGLLCDGPRIARIMNSKKPIWSYECVSQVRSLSPLRYNRGNAWRAKFFGLEGIGHWTHSTIPFNPWLTGEGINDEYALVYPGDVPVTSVRWEAVRDGLEDVAAIELLEAQIEKNKDVSAKKDAVARAREILRIACNDMMELSDAAYVQSRDYLKKGDRMIPHTWTDAEIFRLHRSQIAKSTMELME